MKSTKPDSAALLLAAHRATEREKTAWKLLVQPTESIPAGFRSIKEWSVIWGKKTSRTGTILHLLTNAKKMQRRNFKVALPSGQPRSIAHYKLL